MQWKLCVRLTTPPRRHRRLSSDSTHVVLLVMLPTSRYDQGANATLTFGKTTRGTSSTRPSHRARLAKLGLFLSLLCPYLHPNDYRRSHEGLSLQEPRSFDERHPWHSTRVSVPSFRVSCQKCPFVSPVSRRTKTFWPTRRRGKRPSATSSSVRFTLWPCLSMLA